MSPDKQLVELLGVLVERFGTSRSLGEVYATCYALGMLREGKKLSLSEVAATTGCSKQNLSRWLQQQIDLGQAKTRSAEDDARILEIDITDPMWAYRHLEAVANILNCDLDPMKSTPAVAGPDIGQIRDSKKSKEK
jgi:transcriptional regulator with XRE-family HTH domain